MKNLVFKPYPYQYTFERLPQITLLIFTVDFLFLFIFRPFNVNYSEHRFNYLSQTLIQSSMAALVILIHLSLFNVFFRKWKSDSEWKLYKEVLLILGACFYLGIKAFFIRELIYDNPNNFSLNYFYEEITHSFLVGGVFFGIYTFVNYYRLSILNKKEALTISKDLGKDRLESSEVIHIETHVKNDSFDLDLDQFILARADGNYVEFYIKNSTGIDKKLVRLSLKDLEDQLKSHRFIIRTHRTFVVNSRKIKKVSGNALGYAIDFDDVDFQVPVSRGKIKEFNLVINQD